MSQIRERWPPQGLPSAIQSGTLANRPAAAVANRYYWATDVFMLYRDTGAAWEVTSYGRIYQRIVNDYFGWGSNINSVANRAFGSFHELRVRSTVERLGVIVGAERVNGNMMLGMYGPYPNFDMVCLTAAIAVNTLTINIHNWFDPTTTPIAQPGMYLLVCVCDTVYLAATTGMRFSYYSSPHNRDYLDLEADGYDAMVRMDGAYPLPDPFVPVNHNLAWILGVKARVTPVT